MSWNRPGESRFGIHSIDHFALEVPSLSEASRFFSAFGLHVTEARDCLELRTHWQDHVWTRVYEGARKRLAYLSLGCYPEELPGLDEQLRAAGARDASGATYTSSEGIWYLDLDGNLLQVKVSPKMTPSGIASRSESSRRAGARGVQPRKDAQQVRPRRLSHAVMFTPDMERAVGFYRDALGIRLSDRSHDAVVFMHGRHGSDHHLIALVGSSARGWHHSAWDVASVDDVGAGAEQMRTAGYLAGWGLGRHALGSNYFHYVRDPWGSFAEYSAEMDFVPAGAQWPAADHPPEDSMYLWGPALPADFVRNTEA
jgi:catechol 2,3-dioxygenase-like lactoylglutathione lyase family enzyme